MSMNNKNSLLMNPKFRNFGGEEKNRINDLIEKVGDALELGDDTDQDKYEYDFYIDEDVEDKILENNPVCGCENFDEKEEMMGDAKNVQELAKHLDKIVENSSKSRYEPTKAQTSSQADFNQHLCIAQPIRGLEQNLEDLDLLDKTEFDEKILIDLNNVSCLCDTNNVLHSKENKTTLVTNKFLNGKLILTTYRLLFLPYESENANDLFSVDRNLQLFNTRSSPLSQAIPLSFIHDIKATSNISDKFKKVKTIIDSTNPIIKDLLIKCKNFMTKQFTFNEYLSNTNAVSKFCSTLLLCANSQVVMHNRFQHLINKLNFSKIKNIKNHHHYSNSDDIAVRKSYLISSDLQSDLIESNCELFMQVKNDFTEVFTTSQCRFLIDLNMPFCVLPRNMTDIITIPRVVINEFNVDEFTEHSSDSIVSQTSKKSNMFTSYIGSSSRSIKSNAKNGMQTYLPQEPMLAAISTSNPFYDNKFPVWSYTEPNTNCSIIVVPEGAPNRQDECEIILKNYNSFLCDETKKLSKSLNKQTRSQLINVSANFYSDYEYYKLQVPLTNDKIASSYHRLMDLCSFKTKLDFYKDNDTFYSRLQNTKWMLNISTILSYTYKIINCIVIKRKNVFLDEHRNNLDASCILTSLSKICLNSKYRSIIGLENLIQKEWFLAGHLFKQRLHTPINFNYDHSTSGGRRLSVESNDAQQTTSSTQSTADTENSNTITPTFLLFLDCLFQLLLQYPTDFEYNEAYLIQLWDFSLSSLSFTYSFNGISDWLSFLKNNYADSVSPKTPIPRMDHTYLTEIFKANNNYWQNYLKSNKSFFVSRHFQPRAMFILPCEKIYMLRFWSRCYLRWFEKWHSYNSVQVKYHPVPHLNFTDDVNALKAQRPAPLPPNKPNTIKPQKSPLIEKDAKTNSTKITNKSNQGNKTLVSTTIKSDGSFESSF